MDECGPESLKRKEEQGEKMGLQIKEGLIFENTVRIMEGY